MRAVAELALALEGWGRQSTIKDLSWLSIAEHRHLFCTVACLSHLPEALAELTMVHPLDLIHHVAFPPMVHPLDLIHHVAFPAMVHPLDLIHHVAFPPMVHPLCLTAPDLTIPYGSYTHHTTAGAALPASHPFSPQYRYSRCRPTRVPSYPSSTPTTASRRLT